MFESFLITFRESLEAALIVGIVMAFLKKNNNQKYYSLVLLSLASAIVGSLFFAYIFSLLEGGFTGHNEELFEGATMIIAAGFLSYMILWMFRQKNPSLALKQKLEGQSKNLQTISLYFLVFFAVLREGVETVLFLNAIRFNGQLHMLWGFAGIFAALSLGYLLFVIEVKIPIKRFFQVSSLMLILFAGGLIAHGVHEFEEAGVIPVLVEHVYDINHIVNEKSLIGSFAKGLVGYNGNPSLGELLSYLIYVTGAIYLFNRKPASKALS